MQKQEAYFFVVFALKKYKKNRKKISWILSDKKAKKNKKKNT